MRLFSGTIGHKSPDPRKNMIQNYIDHLSCIEVTGHRIWKKLDRESILGVLLVESMNRIKIFQRLRDGHDYFDEVLGALVGSTLCSIAAVGFVAYSLWELATSVMMNIGILKSDHEPHFDHVVKGMFCAMTAFVMSMVIHMKSMISLVTRPLMTLFFGYNQHQEVDRFYVNEPIRHEFDANESTGARVEVVFTNPLFSPTAKVDGRLMSDFDNDYPAMQVR